MNITGLRLPIIIGPGLYYRGVAAGISDMAISCHLKKTLNLDMPSTPLDLMYVKDLSEIFVKIINSDKRLKNVYNLPSYRTNSIKISKQFNKVAKGSYINVNNKGIATSYPKMLINTFKKDIRYAIKYNLEATVKDWIKELKRIQK